jgi:hypothetical protein
MKKASAGYLGCTAAALASFAAMSRADVTIEQKTSLDVASVVRMHGATTSSVTGDKKREDTESHCEGMMSLLCGNVKSGEIVRLDRDVTWKLEPDKKRYLETVFATPAELAAMRARVQANLEKMRSCPATQKQQPAEKSKCEMSPPKIDVHKTDDRLTIAGHDAQRTSATLVESCTNTDTGDVCDTVVAFDLWLTQDELPGSADRRAFAVAYARKLGLDDPQGVMRAEVSKFLAAYQTQIKQLTDKSADLKGQPMKTSMRILVGGPHCSSAAGAAGGAGASPANPLANVTQAGKAVGQLMGGLFHKKKSDDSQDAASSAGGSGAPAPAAPDPYAQYSQVAAFTSETVSISSDAIPPSRFDVPPDWTKDVPKPSEPRNDDYTCPKS